MNDIHFGKTEKNTLTPCWVLLTYLTDILIKCYPSKSRYVIGWNTNLNYLLKYTLFGNYVENYYYNVGRSIFFMGPWFRTNILTSSKIERYWSEIFKVILYSLSNSSSYGVPSKRRAPALKVSQVGRVFT